MSNQRAPDEYLPQLPPGLLVGDWRVVERHGYGSFGVIYRAVRVGHEDAGPVALKLSVYPWDPRFAREAELLARIQHPCVPRLLSRGVLRHVSGVEHPYFVMEWIDGTPLYAWADQHAPSSRQVLLLLAQLARALATTHSAHCVHRDVKGDNILVRHSDGQPVLVDFGSGHFQGASRLTWGDLAPVTPAYRSFQASLFYLRSVRDRDAYYEPSPADDVFALGVTAYRLVMGEYPPAFEPLEDETGSWQLVSDDPRPLLERNPRVPPRLRELILRMLSDTPEARGAAAELAEALEAAAAEPPEPVSTASPPTVAHASEVPPRPEPAAVPPEPLAPPSRVPPEPVSSRLPAAPASHAPDAGTSAVGDAPPSAPPASDSAPSKQKPVAQSPLPEPRPGQLRPDSKGRCLVPKQVALNGGCWVVQPSMTAEDCTASGYAYSRGRCYAPALESPQKTVPTSSPPEPR